MTTVAGHFARAAVASAVAFFLATANASATNTFSDGTLDTYTGSNATSPVWKERGDTGALSNFGGAARIANTLFAGLYQSFSVTGNTVYKVSFDLKLTSTSGINPLFAFSAYAVSNFSNAVALFANPNNIRQTFTNLNPPSSSFQTYSFEFKSGNQGNVAVGFGGSIGGRGNLQFDNINVTAVPGPIVGAGLPALVGLLGLGWLARRRSSTSA